MLRWIWGKVWKANVYSQGRVKGLFLSLKVGRIYFYFGLIKKQMNLM